MSRLGFSTRTASGGQDFPPFIKYDARAGLFKRVDRVFDGQSWSSPETIIAPDQFCALFDMENTEVGPMNFADGAPSMVLVRMADLEANKAYFPQPPTPRHKNGVRVMVKLHPSIAGDKPIREIASNAKTFCRGFELLDSEYVAQRGQHPGQLPVVRVSGVTMVKTGSGQKTSTNFQPTFAIVGWAPRGDLQWSPKTVPQGNGQQQPQQQAPQQQAYPQRPSHGFTPPMTGGPQQSYPQQPPQYGMNQQGVPGQTPLPWDDQNQGAPATGSERAPPPPQQQVNHGNSQPARRFDANDFG